jgi:hypothetical protein
LQQELNKLLSWEIGVSAMLMLRNLVCQVVTLNSSVPDSHCFIFKAQGVLEEFFEDSWTIQVEGCVFFQNRNQ